MGSLTKTYKQAKKVADFLAGASKKKKKPEQRKHREASSSEVGIELIFSYGFIDIYRNGKEWFSGDVVCSEGDRWLAYGHSGETETLVFGDEGTVLATKKWEDATDTSVIHDNRAFVFGSERMAVLERGSSLTRAFGYDMAADGERVLSEECAAYLDYSDEGDAIMLYCFVFETKGSWKKKIDLPLDDEGSPIDCSFQLSHSPGELIVEIADTTHRYTVEGEAIGITEADVDADSPQLPGKRSSCDGR